MKKSLKLIGFAFSAYLTGCSIFTNNFHQVENAPVYRSGQLDKKDLEEKIKKHNLRSVVNLRGADPGDEWYEDESSVCQKFGVKLYDISMSARRLPTKEEVKQLLDVFDQGKYPMLVHCRAGADRSALGVAIYRIHILGHDVEEADDELSLWYGHFGVPCIGTYELDRFFIVYKKSGAKSLREYLKK